MSNSSVQKKRNCSHRLELQNAVIIIVAMMIASFTNHAYALSSHQCAPSASSLHRMQPSSMQLFKRRRNACCKCWSVANDELQDEESNGAKSLAPDMRSNENKLDNLIPSTMMASFSGSRRLTGLSSSALIPPSESDEMNLPSLFQSSISSQGSSSLHDVSIINNNNGSWKERLLDVSNFASLLCVLDCTLLPLVSIAIPALSWSVGFMVGSGGAFVTVPPALSAFLAHLPALSHGIALFFVVPVGLLTTVINYIFGHREVKFSMAALFGVALIYAANGSAGFGIPSIDAWLHSVGIIAGGGLHDHARHVHNACGAMVGAVTNMMSHTCSEGLAHRMTNTVGCALLLGSNYASRKYMEEKNSGCAASALVEAWSGDGGRRMVCPPGCGCERPSFGTKSSRRSGKEMFFEWERSSSGNRGGKARGGRLFNRLRR
jgi:hypothetical protein